MVLRLFAGLTLAAVLAVGPALRSFAQPAVIEDVLPRVAKVFGSGGLNRLESWQTAIAVSPDGLFVTAWSYVLDSGATLVLHDGQRFEAELLGYHPRLELALLRIDVADQPFFEVRNASSAATGVPILAFSNLYGIATGNESVSVQRGVVAATTDVATRRGPRAQGYQGPAIVVDAIINNPGAAGGAITDRQGRLMGVIGRESRNADNNLWLNFAIPAEQVEIAIGEIMSGRTESPMLAGDSPAEPVTLELLGLVLVPAVVANTPGWVEQVLADTPAARGGIRSDDLIVQINGVPTVTTTRIQEQLQQIDRDRPFSLTVQRDGKFVNLEMVIDR